MYTKCINELGTSTLLLKGFPSNLYTFIAVVRIGHLTQWRPWNRLLGRLNKKGPLCAGIQLGSVGP